MDRAREKARELGRNLLSMATGGGSSDDGRERLVARRRSWCEVVSGSPPRACVKQQAVLAGMPAPVSTDKLSNSVGSSLGRGRSPQKIFSASDVAKLVEIARNQLRKEKQISSGWTEVESRENKQKEKIYVQELLEGYQGSPESLFRCWQCDKPGHKSSECPEGERCFACNSQGHKRAECPAKRKPSRAEKGKSLDPEKERSTHFRPTIGVRIGEVRQGTTGGIDTHRLQATQGRGEGRKELSVKERQWRPIMETKGKPTARPGRQPEDVCDLRGNTQGRVMHGHQNVVRPHKAQPVFFYQI